MVYCKLPLNYELICVQITKSMPGGGGISYSSHSYRLYDGPIDRSVLEQVSEYMEMPNAEVKIMAFRRLSDGEDVFARIRWMQDNNIPQEVEGEGLWGLVKDSTIIGDRVDLPNTILFREL